jgi:hypothetical protein
MPPWKGTALHALFRQIARQVDVRQMTGALQLPRQDVVVDAKLLSDFAHWLTFENPVGQLLVSSSDRCPA